MNRTFIALILSAALVLPGCSTINGEPAQLNNAGKILVAAVLVGGLIALAANQDDNPKESYVTTCGGGTCRTDVYR